ncbi:hypothetical protein ACH42_11635 [Endozoicomonas sp. (ex Bugula neritina AB1)]|nr:hypothetical protein ACH42_11635 [Endozoicomonas sp. (ex Bugula neritina AB1)]
MALNSDNGKLKVIRHDPARDRRLKIILFVLIVVLGVVAYWYGGNSANQVSNQLQLENLSLEDRVEILQKDNKRLRQQVTVLESAGRVDREAINNVRVLVRQLEEEKEQLNKDLTFYKSVMAPEDLEPGIRIAGLDLIAGSAQNTYKIRLVISQVARLNPFLKGQLSVSLSGQRNDKSETISLHKLAGLKESTTALGFRYFQALPDNRGFLEFQLPEGFQPDSINVAVRVQKGMVKNFNQTLEWDKELAADVQQE